MDRKMACIIRSRLIQEDKPEDQGSRWLSDSGKLPQYVSLQLQKPAIATAIVFGKYHRTHACNIRKLKILGGMQENTLMMLYEG